MESAVAWTKCALIERVPGTLSGVPVIRRSRVRLDDLLVDRDDGDEWRAEAYRPPIQTPRAVLALYDQHKTQLAPAV